MNNLQYELKERLPDASQNEIEKLAEQGWEFRSNYWESGHNGDPYDDVEFKSPNMKEFSSIGEYDWRDRVNRRYLLKQEAESVAREWTSEATDDSSFVGRPVELALTKYFLKRKDAGFEQIHSYDPNIKFVVKCSPKNIHKPKHIKVTIEIT
jgi:hypothetical protein